MACHAIFRRLSWGIFKFLSCKDNRTGKGYTPLSGSIQFQYRTQGFYNIWEWSLNDLWCPYRRRMHHRSVYVRLAQTVNRQFCNGRDLFCCCNGNSPYYVFWKVSAYKGG